MMCCRRGCGSTTNTSWCTTPTLPIGCWTACKSRNGWPPPTDPGLTITLAEHQSGRFREILKAIQTRRGDAVNRTGGGAIDAETKEREDIDILVHCTLDWTIK